MVLFQIEENDYSIDDDTQDVNFRKLLQQKIIEMKHVGTKDDKNWTITVVPKNAPIIKSRKFESMPALKNEALSETTEEALEDIKVDILVKWKQGEVLTTVNV